ncbi:MAG: hypothetical protein RLZZ200_48 [Pseudomonadota bacterium]|jgi:hypothetical protein
MFRPTIFVLLVATVLPCADAAGLPDEVHLPGTGIFPESITSTKDGSLYIGSMGKGVVYRARPGADVAEPFIAAGSGGLLQVFGVYADERQRTLWVCSNPLNMQPGQPRPPSALHAFDLGSGAPKGRYEFPKDGGCNDIVTAVDGTAYATDTPGMQVLRLKKGGAALEVWAGHGVFGPAGGVLDGITIVDKRVIVNTLVTSKLFAVDVARDGSASQVTELKLTRPVLRPDGMRALDRDSLLSTDGTGKIVRVTLLDHIGTVRTVKEGFDGVVSVTPVGRNAYAIEGQLAGIMRAPNTPAPPERPYKATRVPLD